jgi:hypothetical protein
MKSLQSCHNGALARHVAGSTQLQFYAFLGKITVNPEETRNDAFLAVFADCFRSTRF